MQQKRLDSLVAAINECIIQLNEAELWETAELMRMARLDLLARANGITDEELELFSFALQRGAKPHPPHQVS